MKKITKRNFLIVMLLMLTCCMAKAQESLVGKFSVIPRIGVCIANMSGNSVLNDGNELKSKSKAGFMGGIDVEYRASKDLAVGVGAYYSQQGYRYADFMTLEKEENGIKTYSGYHDNHANLHYINVPLTVKGYLFDGFAVTAGLQVGFFLSGKIEGEVAEVKKDKNGSTTYQESKPMESVDFPGKSIEWSIPVGVSYEYMNVILDARYHFGLSHASKEDDEVKNKAITISVGYRFTL